VYARANFDLHTADKQSFAKGRIGLQLGHCLRETKRALMKLQQLNAAGDLKDLSIPSSNQLGGNRFMAARKIKLTHPGRILREELKCSISPEMAVLLSAYFGTSDGYWINLQGHFDLEIARDKVGKQAARINPHSRGADGSLQPVLGCSWSTNA
jgi:antitoxin HigA-1